MINSELLVEGTKDGHLLLVASGDTFALLIVQALAFVRFDAVVVALEGEIIEESKLGLELLHLGSISTNVHCVIYIDFN